MTPSQSERIVIRSSEIAKKHRKMEEESKKKERDRKSKAWSNFAKRSSIETRKILHDKRTSASTEAFFLSIPSQWYKRWKNPKHVALSRIVEEDDSFRFLIIPSDEKIEESKKISLKRSNRTHFMVFPRKVIIHGDFENIEYAGLKRNVDDNLEYFEVFIPKKQLKKRDIIHTIKKKESIY